MATKPWAIALVVFCTLITSLGQFTIKLGIQDFSFDMRLIITNWYLLGGFALYFLGAALLIIALKHGELSVLYPVIALSFVWVNLLSGWFLHEMVSSYDWIGIAFIIAGVSLIGYGSNRGASC